MLVRVEKANAALVPVTERFLMDGTVMAIESVRLVTVGEILSQVVLVPVQNRVRKAHSAIGLLAMTQSAYINAHAGPAQMLQGRIVMERTVITMENVRLVTVVEFYLQVVLVPVKKRKRKAKAAIKCLAMTQSAFMHVHVGPAQILQGRIVMERVVIRIENVRLVTVEEVLDYFVEVAVQERKGKAKDAVEGLAMTRSAYINAHAGPAQIGGISFLMGKNAIGKANVGLILVDTGIKVLVVTQSVDDDLKISLYCC